MSSTLKRARDLTPQQLSELVLRRKQQRDAAAAATADRGIARRGASSAPLSFAQQRLWLLDQLEPRNPAYNLATASRLRGALDAAALARSLSEICRRHESLRTHFELRRDEPVQVIAAAAPLPLPRVDLASLPEAARAREVRRLVREEATTPFDLARGPLVRAALLRLDAAEHVLLLDMHHIVSDGWSVGLLFGELAALYGTTSSGSPSPLPELPIQYADFACWQRERLQGAALEEQVAWWRQRLAGAAPSLELPADRARPPLQTHRGDFALLTIDPDLAASLRDLARRQRGTLFMTLLAAWKVLLHRWAGQDDVVVGSPSAGRQRVETEGLIGFFLNTLVLRTDLSGDPSFLALLERVRETVLGAYRYQDVPFERLVDELRVERQLSHTPLFQVLFNMITVPEIRRELRGLEVAAWGMAEPLAKFDLTLYAQESGGAIACSLLYNADLFDAARMRALLGELRHLLAQIAGAPETPIQALSLVAPETAAALPDPSRPLPEAAWPGPFERRLSLAAARSPEREVVRDGSETWTRGELETRSNQLAHRLLRAGVAREDVVAVYAHRGASLVWAILGTLKAGAAFLVLDPVYPPRRLAEYLAIARPAAWLTVPGAGEPPPAVEEALAALGPRLRLDLPPRSAAAAAGWLAGLPATPPEVATGPDDLACVVFTSGSTGAPKAVAGRLGPLSQFQPWWQEEFELGPGDRFGMLSALSHDPLQRDVLTPLWLGASLTIPDPERMGEPGWLAGWAARERVTAVNLTPAMLELLVGGAGAGSLPALRRAFVVGDLLRRSEVVRLQRIAPGVTCVNLYGSTETQRAVAYTVVCRPGEPPAGKEALPLGRGIPGVELVVRNAAGALAGIGEVGEVCVRSRQLARGYLGDPELTARRFLSNPFRPGSAVAGGDPADRLYLTGDLGRYQPDGEVELAGRADQQVKIRGFRIEPGEVEAALRAHPAVRECVVVARGEGEAGKRLVAFLVPASEGRGAGDAAGRMEDGGAVPARELRALLAARLPEYMIPAAFAWLPALPMTATGKLDRRALPEPAAALAAAEGFLPPRTPLEELLAGIWLELLGGVTKPLGRAIGIDDNFFELGGHSLLATRALARIREALGVEVPLRALFEAPTIAGLAEAVERRQGEARPAAAPPLVPVPRGGAELPLSFAQQRLWVLEQLAPGGFAHNLAAAVRLRGELGAAALGLAIAEIARRHEALRTVFPAVDGEPRQEILAPAAGRRLPLADLAALPADRREREAARLAGDDALRPFDLVRGPLLRATLVRLGEREHALLLAMHHLVTDGWSLGIFTRELGELYRAFAAGSPSPLGELPLQYADFAVWQRQWLQGEALAEQLRYFRGALAGAPPLLELPADRSRPAVQSHRGGRRWLTLPGELTARLAAESRRLDATPFMFLLAAFAVLLQRYSGEEDLVVGTPIANRRRREVEELIGFFANTLALRVDAAGDPTFAELVRRVRQAALGAYAHQDLPFERLVDELRPRRDLGHSPIFQAMLILQNAVPPRLELGDLVASPLDAEVGKAQFDLTLSLLQIDGDLLAKLEYASDLFDAATAERLLDHFGSLLAGAAAGPRARIGALPLLAEEERRQLVAAWNDTRAELPAERTIDELFEASARRAPAAVAVRCGGRQLLYGELAERADRLARHLARLGVGPEVRVALCLERTPEMLVAMLAVLKAGGAYVPLDPSHPGERLRWIVEDAGAPVLVADRASLAALPEPWAVVVDPAAIVADAVADRAAAPAAAAPPLRRAQPENLAYVLYTSGSTGRPKGVQVCHAAVVNYLCSMARRPGLAAGDTVLAATTLSFDIAVTELLLPLAVGACVELVDQGTAADPARLAAVVESAGVTVMQATPTAWALLLESGWQGRPGLRALAGGEALEAGLAARLRPRVGELWNVYGPTETTVWSTLHPVAATDGGERRVPIGRPLANTTVHLIDRRGELVPVGVPGELCIGGAGLARGYLGRPGLTAERFVPDPVGSAAGDRLSAGARLYRTGDLARRLPGGELECLGRLDHQVKVRGFRIEPGEIEAALAAVAGVTRAAVVVRERAVGERQLVAFVATGRGGGPAAGDAAAAPGLEGAAAPAGAAAPPTPPIGELRVRLRERLPDYMMPAAFVFLDALPLTPSGKVDRRALARLPIDPMPGAEGQRQLAAPRDEVEELLAGIWAEVLRLEQVGIHDNFFELGGDSVLGIRMTARAGRAGVHFSLRHLFQHQTIAALAAAAVIGPLAEVLAAAPPLPSRPATDGGAFSPADFPAAGLTQEGLDEVLAELAMD
jgi:amino acid adenylation domain-containing protein